MSYFDKKSFSLYFKLFKFIWNADKTYFFIALFDAFLMPLINLYLAWITALFINELVSGNIKSFYDPTIFKIIIAYILIPLITATFEYIKISLKVNRKVMLN